MNQQEVSTSRPASVASSTSSDEVVVIGEVEYQVRTHDCRVNTRSATVSKTYPITAENNRQETEEASEP
jgi:outer membrane lipopolysaccharide assembly protein LptE/RlpB